MAFDGWVVYHLPVEMGFMGLFMVSVALGQPALTSREEVAQALRTMAPEELVARGQQAVQALGTYTYRMLKQERVNGVLLPEDEIQTFVRERPFAVRLHYLKGPSAGRRVAWAPAVRADEFRVREAGMLSYTGSWWIGVDDGLAKRDSNHTIREAGMGPLLNRFAKDQAMAKPLGGYSFTHEGWDARGHWCTFLLAPNKGKGFDSAKTRICTDPDLRLPMKVETFTIDDQLIERYVMSKLVKHVATDEFFDPAKL
jgi:hypothetical protein